MEILRKKFTIILIITIFFRSFSQEISLDLQNSGQKTDTKPAWSASGLNLILPGSGYIYLSQNKPAAAFLTADVLLWGGFFYTYATSKTRFDDSKSYARTYAHTQSARPSGDKYWNYLANENFMRVEDFNKAMLNNREFNKLYAYEIDSWNWDSEENRDEYAQIRQKAVYWKTASTLVLGSLALNRLVSFVSARVATRKHNEKIKIFTSVAATAADFEPKTVSISFLLAI